MEIYWCVYSINRKFERKWLHRNAGKKRNKWERKGWCHLQNDSIVFALRLTTFSICMHALSLLSYLSSFPFPPFSSIFFLPFPVFLFLVPLLFCFHSLFLICFCFFPFTPLHMWLLCFVSVFNHFFPKHTHTHTHLCLILLCIITYFFCPFCFDVAV